MPPLIPPLPPHTTSKNTKSFSSLFTQAFCRQLNVKQGKKPGEKKGLASNSAVSMAMPLTYTTHNRVMPSSESLFFKPLPLSPCSKAVAAATSNLKSNVRFQVKASMKEKAVTALTAAALTASMVVPDVAEAAVTPSLKNFLLSIVAGGVVLVVLVGAVIAVANFDPVKRS